MKCEKGKDRPSPKFRGANVSNHMCSKCKEGRTGGRKDRKSGKIEE